MHQDPGVRQRFHMTHTMNVKCVASTHRGKGGCDMSRESCQFVAPLRGNRCKHTPRGLVDAASVSRVYLSLTLPPLKGLRREPWPVPATPRVGCCKDHTGWFLCTHDVAHGRGGSRRRTDHCNTAKRDFRQTDDRHFVTSDSDTNNTTIATRSCRRAPRIGARIRASSSSTWHSTSPLRQLATRQERRHGNTCS